MGRKYRGKRRNCPIRTISPFLTVFLRLILQTRKNQGLFGKRLSFKKEMFIILATLILSHANLVNLDKCKTSSLGKELNLHSNSNYLEIT